MSRSTLGHEEAKTSLLGGKELIKYDTLKGNSGGDGLGSQCNSALPVRRKVWETQKDAEIELIAISNQPSTESNICGKESNTVLLYEDILPDDTLQSFALRYGCSVNDIKRANGLIAEQDFYALKKLKIPVNRYSLLTVPEEKLKLREVHDNLYSCRSQATKGSFVKNFNQTKNSFETVLPSEMKPDTPSSSEFDSTENSEETASLLPSLPSSEHWKISESSDASRYLKKLDQDIRKTVKKADMKNGHSHQNESLNEVLSSIQYFPVEPLRAGLHRGRMPNGADCGMKWWVVILCFFIILGIVIALAIFEYERSN